MWRADGSQCRFEPENGTVWHWSRSACTFSVALWSHIKSHHRRKENISRQNPDFFPSDHPDITKVPGMIMKPSSIHGFAGHGAIICSPCHNTMKDNTFEVIKTHELCPRWLQEFVATCWAQSLSQTEMAKLNGDSPFYIHEVPRNCGLWSCRDKCLVFETMMLKPSNFEGP